MNEDDTKFKFNLIRSICSNVFVFYCEIFRSFPDVLTSPHFHPPKALQFKQTDLIGSKTMFLSHNAPKYANIYLAAILY